jgi:hypothetical protein
MPVVIVLNWWVESDKPLPGYSDSLFEDAAMMGFKP